MTLPVVSRTSSRAGVPLQFGQQFVERRDFRRKVVGFALRVGRAVGPTHPGRDTVDASVPGGGQLPAEPLFDAIVAGDAGRPFAAKRLLQNVFPAPDMPTNAIRCAGDVWLAINFSSLR